MSEDLIVSLRKEVTTDETVLAESLGLHLGASIPFRMFARVAIWSHRNGAWIEGRADLEKTIKRRANRALALFAASILTVVGGIAHRLVEEGRSEERSEQQERRRLEDREVSRRESDELRRQISELRADLRRLSGADRTQPNSDISEPIDRFSFVEQWHEMLKGYLQQPTFSATIHPDSCFQICSSQAECSGTFGTCKYCNAGFCKSTPFIPGPTPAPPDAGVDAGRAEP